jgi:DnaJ-domain-containing protein 1
MSLKSVARKARELLDKKAAQELPDAGRLRGAALQRKESSADAFFSALVEGAFLISAADGELSEDEESTLSETMGYVTGEVLEPDAFMEMIDSFASALADDGLDARLSALAAAVPDEAARREVLAFAALLALCDHNLVETEQRVLSAMGQAFALSEAEVQSITAAVAKAID